MSSNTSAHGFLKCTSKKMKVDEKLTNDSIEEVLAPFRDLSNSGIGLLMQSFGKEIAPLNFVGHFLNYAGNHLLHYIY